MTNWFLGRVSFDEEQGNGSLKKVSEDYLVNAYSFTEAEAKLVEEMGVDGRFEVQSVKKEKVWELRRSENENGLFFKSKLALITLDEKSGKEKMTSVNVYTQNEKIDDVHKSIDDIMRESMMAFKVTSITETKIVGIILA